MISSLSDRFLLWEVNPTVGGIRHWILVFDLLLAILTVYAGAYPSQLQVLTPKKNQII